MNIVELLTDCVREKIPVSFSKYGDGEYHCAIQGYADFDTGKCNCDADVYTEKLQQGIVQSFKYMVENAENSYIGRWHSKDNSLEFWNKLVEDKNKIKWADYHTFIIDINDFKNNIDNLQNKIKLYETIQNSDLQKIIICNPILIKSAFLLKSKHLIHVPFNNWFDTYFDDLILTIKNIVGNNEQPMIITSCGMGAKVLICELNKMFPKGIFLDVGSAMDFICTKRDSRGREYSYEILYNSMKHILPEDWHDPKYDELYETAKKNMGIHL
jgi:hypothetical protein